MSTEVVRDLPKGAQAFVAGRTSEDSGRKEQGKKLKKPSEIIAHSRELPPEEGTQYLLSSLSTIAALARSTNKEDARRAKIDAYHIVADHLTARMFSDTDYVSFYGKKHPDQDLATRILKGVWSEQFKLETDEGVVENRERIRKISAKLRHNLEFANEDFDDKQTIIFEPLASQINQVNQLIEQSAAQEAQPQEAKPSLARRAVVYFQKFKAVRNPALANS